MKKLIIKMWGVWDSLYFFMNRMEYIADDNILRIVRTTYNGPPLQTKNGNWIRPGDPVLKIHLYNYRIAHQIRRYPSEIAFAICLKNEMTRSLRGLYRFMQQEQLTTVTGIIGTSMMNRGANRLGFTLHDAPKTYRNWLKGKLYRIIYLLIHPSGYQYLRQHGARLKSKHIVMSTEELAARYADDEQNGDDHQHEYSDFDRNEIRGRALSSS